MPVVGPESEIQNRKSKIQNPKCLASGRQDAGGVEVGRAGRAGGPRSQRVAPNPKFRIENPKSKTENRKPKIENRKLKIEKRKAKLENGNRKLENGESKTQNRQSSIVNLHLPQPPTPNLCPRLPPTL